MNGKIKRHLLLAGIFALCLTTYGQSPWPSKTWSEAVNMSSLLPAAADELSGMYWNNVTKRLFVVGDAGWVYLLQYNKPTQSFTSVGYTQVSGGTEGITQVNNAANEFYTIDEDNYEIRKYTFVTPFSNVTQTHSWNLLASPSTMPNTGNDGPEGITFVPDWYLQRVGFTSSATGQLYVSTKGLGGLLFIAHQIEGEIWVYDVNPNVSDDFAFVGKYKSSRAESCDLAFDHSTGLMYILHNIDANYLEVTDMRTTVVNGNYKFVTHKEYLLPTPGGDINIEGFAIAPKYPEDEALGAWLCRDVIVPTEMNDAIRWFAPFAADGSNLLTTTTETRAYSELSIFPSPASYNITIDSNDTMLHIADLRISSPTGQIIETKQNIAFPHIVDVQKYYPGVYIVKIRTNYNTEIYEKFIKR